jgi:hypothetical protein
MFSLYRTTQQTLFLLESCERSLLLFLFRKAYNETVHQLFMDLKNTFDSAELRGVLYNTLIELGTIISMKLVKIIM